jgi:FtsP/CotA-like multicopper oxidase with cupredoxin domain
VLRSYPSLVLRALGGIALLVAIVAGSSLLTRTAPAEAGAKTTPPCKACEGYATGQPLQTPNAVSSVNGVLDYTLTAGLSTFDLGGRTVRSEVYNGQFPGTTLVVNPGDKMNVMLRNRMKAKYLPYGASSKNPPPQFPGQPYAGFPQRLGNITNLHVHGMHVSPIAPSDDVLLKIPPGSQYQYRYQLPEDHPTGLFWYHPHGHHYADMQVGEGQAGAIIVKGGLDDVPGIKGLVDRLMVFQNVTVRNGAVTSSQYLTPEHRLITINGQVQPRIDIRPGETQRWRLLNASYERFLRILPMEGARYWQLSSDASTFAHPKQIGELWLAPGQRMEVLVQAGQKTGAFPLVQSYFNQRPTPYGKQPRVQVASLNVTGAAQTPQEIPANLLPARDLRGPEVKIAARHTIRFTQAPPRFFIDGALFHDHGGTVGPTFVVGLNTVEEWKISNASPEWHNFHLHVDDYQIVRRDGKAVKGEPEWADSIAVPPGKTITIRIPFTDYPGTFVFHCHVLVHEDHGMMAVVKVVDRGAPPLVVAETAP